jgi:hypothetical protein
VDARLLHEADQLQARRERVRRSKEIAEMRRCTFQPRIDPKSAALASRQRPVHERAAELQRRKEEKLNQLRVAAVSSDDVTFHPYVSDKSRRMAERRVDTVLADSGVDVPSRRVAASSVTERLALDSSLRTERAQRVRARRQAEATAEHTFAPQLNPRSERIIAQSSMFTGEFSDFVKRQQAFEERRRSELAALKADSLADCTFEPASRKGPVRPQSAGETMRSSRLRLNGGSIPAPGAKPDFIERQRQIETVDDLVTRLSVSDAHRIEARRRQLKATAEKDLVFQPHINPKSRKLVASASSLEDLVSDRRRQRCRQQALAASEKAFAEQHTFRPQLSSTASVGKLVHSRYSARDPEQLRAAIDEETASKEQRLERVRRTLAHEEMRDCTFQPDVSRTARTAPATGPVVVRGLGRHLELRDLARRKEEEQREREEQVFMRGRRPASAAGSYPYTIPQPFNLSRDPKADERAERLRAEAQQRELQECTFAPRTTDLPQRELIRRLVEDDDEYLDDADGGLYPGCPFDDGTIEFTDGAWDGCDFSD